MSAYEPPIENVPEFDVLLFRQDDTPLTIGTANKLYLKYPVAQGAETIANLTSTNITTTNLTTTNISGLSSFSAANLTSTVLLTSNAHTNTNQTTTGTLTLKNGGFAQTATLQQNATTLNVIGAGDISIKPVNDFNVLTGIGKLVNISCPDSAGAATNMTLNTGVANAGSYVNISSPTTYITGLSTQPSLVLSGGYGTIYGMTFTRGGTALAAVNRIQSPNASDTFYLGAGSSSANNITLTNGQTAIDVLSVFNHNIRIQQNDYTQPMGNTSQLGYTNSATTTTDPMSNTLTARSNFSLPSKGVWLIICGYKWSTNTSNTVEAKELILSTTSGGSTPAAYGLEYYEEINDAAGGATPRQIGTITGVVSVTAATTIYVNARSQVGGGTNTAFTSNVSWTRIG